MTRREEVRQAVEEARQRLGLPPSGEYRTKDVPVPGTIFTRPVEVPMLDHGEVLRFVRDNYFQPITRGTVARRFKKTPRSISNVFNEQGTTFLAVVQDLRMKRARKLLSLDRAKLRRDCRKKYVREKVIEARKTVSWAGGAISFRTAFKLKFGVTPQGYLWKILDRQNGGK